jgi:hypothetical protein
VTDPVFIEPPNLDERRLIRRQAFEEAAQKVERWRIPAAMLPERDRRPLMLLEVTAAIAARLRGLR